MRKDKKKTVANKKYVDAFKTSLKKIKKGGPGISGILKKFYSQVDRAVREKVIHKNKGNRLKSRAARYKSKS